MRYTESFTPEARFEVDEHTLALYHFDEGQGETLIDSSGNEHHGTIYGATWVKEVALGRGAVDVDRQVTEWVLARGGFVDCRSELGETVRVTSTDELPVGRIEIQNVNLFDADIDDDDLGQLTTLQHLTGLFLDRASVGDEGMRHVGQIVTLRYLTLRETAVTDRGVQLLGNLSSLVELRLSKLDITDESLPTIGQLTELQNLSLDETDITDAGLRELSDLVNLKALFVPHTNISGEGLAHLADLPNLRGLYLSFTNTSDSSLQIIGSMEQLTILSLQAAPISERRAGASGLSR